uniref:Uncharacterized protein n=1 Tax=Utricularia reniformis TaxID=192314 RepID=A0A1Y0B0L2_9LAMI|nr:hypothetical protein AEK19_MT0660 [Utricularia reniformis]ART30911.1 hypothetical protein AEK19_MT0660 [Utricularia reniformis]
MEEGNVDGSESEGSDDDQMNTEVGKRWSALESGKHARDRQGKKMIKRNHEKPGIHIALMLSPLIFHLQFF